jgi:regulator of sirC expression with transglutaminase-like and TPR domain
VEGEDVTARFVALARGPAATMPLGEALLLVSAHDHPVDAEGAIRQLDALAARWGSDGPRRLDGLLAGLFQGDEAFAGDGDDYHHPDNSFLDRVLARRRGLPILLAVVAMEVGERAGICLAPVGMPGHFLLRDCGDEDAFVDPFHGGRRLDRAGCEVLFRRLHPGQAFDAGYLDPVDRPTVVARVLTNLVHTYLQRGPTRSLAWAAHLRAEVLGGESWRMAARCLERVGDWQAAADAWDALAATRVEDGDDVATRGAGARARLN